MVQDEYEWLWLYAAVEPTTGTDVFLAVFDHGRPMLATLRVAHLLYELGKGPIGFVLDSSGSHRELRGQVAIRQASALIATV